MYGSPSVGSQLWRGFLCSPVAVVFLFTFSTSWCTVYWRLASLWNSSENPFLDNSQKGDIFNKSKKSRIYNIIRQKRHIGAFSIYQEIPENYRNFVGKCSSAKDVLHLTHSSHSSQAPFTVRCISGQKYKMAAQLLLLNEMLDFSLEEECLFNQMMMTFLSWQPLQPI